MQSHSARCPILLYLLKRVASSVVVFFAVTSFAFILFSLRDPRSIAVSVLGTGATSQDVDGKVASLGLNRPLITQYIDWADGLLRGDLGRSFVSGQEVTAILATRVPVTLSIILMTMLLMAGIGVLLGVLAATRGGVLDRAVQTMSVILGAVPGYWLALIIVIVFSLNLRLFPATGYIPIGDSLVGWFSTIIQPSVAVALGAVFALAVWIRSSIIDMRRQDWVRTLRSRGISSRAIMYRHVLRNAAAPTIQILGLYLIGLLGGTIIVERIFALPGLGTMSVNSGVIGDSPVVLGAITVFVLIIVVINVVVDVLNGFLNPKARLS